MSAEQRSRRAEALAYPLALPAAPTLVPAERRQKPPAKRLARSVAAAVAGGFLSQLMLAVSGVIVSRSLGPVARGQSALLIILPLVTVQVGGLGVPRAVVYFGASRPGTAWAVVAGLRRVVVTQALGLTLIHLALLLVIFRDESRNVVIAAIVTAPLVAAGIVQVYAQALLQANQNFRPWNVVTTGLPVVYTLFVAALVITGHATLPWIVGAWAAASMVTAGTAALLAWRLVVTHETAEGAPPPRTLLAYGARASIGSVAPLETFRIDQLVAGFFLPAAALGYYVAAMAFTNLPRLLGQSVGAIAAPTIAGRGADEGWMLVWRFVVASTLLCLFAAIAIEVALPWVLPLAFGHDFRPAVTTARILVAGGCLLAVRRTLADAMIGRGCPGTNTIAEIVALSLLVLAMFVLVPGGGPEQVAMATVVAAGGGLAVLLGGALLNAQKRAVREPVTGDLP